MFRRRRSGLVFALALALAFAPSCSAGGSFGGGAKSPNGGGGAQSPKRDGDADGERDERVQVKETRDPEVRPQSGEATTGDGAGGGRAAQDAEREEAVVFVDRGPAPSPADAGGDYDFADDGGTAAPEKWSPPAEHKAEKKKDRKVVVSDETIDKSSGSVALPTSTGDTKAGDDETQQPGEAERVGPLLGHGVEVADDWSSNFETIAHDIGPVYTHTGGVPTLTVETIGGLGAREFVQKRGVELVEGAEVELPLEHTHVDAELSGPIGRVHVQQRFTNPYDEVIEAVYTFPLPENSAVDGMKMVIGERVIEGIIMEREAARATYEAARAEGYTAALLEQQRPNVFTQSVANIAPDVTINVETRYVQDLTYDSGRYEFVFPMVVGPRYVPADYASSAGVYPPILGRGERSGSDVSLTVRADAGVAIKKWEVPTHETDGKLDAGGKLDLRLSSKDQIPNRDFVLRYDVADALPAVSVMSERIDGDGFFTLMVQPPENDVDKLVGTREMLFVVDVSGSMSGVPLAMSKELMELALHNLRPVDTFNIITFASGTSRLFEHARPANRQHLAQGLEFVDAMDAGGGTEMLAGVRAAMDAEIDAGVRRSVVFMTDGYIGNEDQVLSQIGESVDGITARQAEARVFAFGVGSSTNRYLIDGLAQTGDGTAHYALNREDPALAVDAFFNVIDHPIWTDVEIDFGGLAVDEDSLHPLRVPDLFASHPIVLHGRYTKGGTGTVTITGRSGGDAIEIPVEVSLSKSKKKRHGGVLGTLWARAAIGSLQRDMLYSNDYSSLKAQITELGLRHAIVTEFTSFVAVDESARVEGGGSGRSVDQGVNSPEGVGQE